MLLSIASLRKVFSTSFQWTVVLLLNFMFLFMCLQSIVSRKLFLTIFTFIIFKRCFTSGDQKMLVVMIDQILLFHKRSFTVWIVTLLSFSFKFPMFSGNGLMAIIVFRYFLFCAFHYQFLS